MIRTKVTMVLASLLLLSACNDSNDSSSNPPIKEPTRFEQWKSFQFGAISKDDADHSDQDELFSTTTTLTIDNNIIYNQIEQSALNPSAAVLYNTYAAQNGIFENTIQHAKYGYELGKIKVTDSAKWVVSPTIVNGSGVLEETTNFKILDISGQKMLYSMSPSTAIQFNGVPYFDDIYHGKLAGLYTNLSNAVFPAGSTCIQVQDKSQNQSTFNMLNYKQPVTTPNDQNSLKAEWDQLKSLNSPLKVLKDTEYYVSTDSTGIAKYHGAYYRGLEKAQGSTYSFADQIAKEKAYFVMVAEEMGPTDKNYTALYEASAKTSCHYFNPTASQAIEAIVKK